MKVYSYNISCGPFLVKGEGHLAKDLDNLENILKYLDQPDLNPAPLGKIKQIPSKALVRFRRLWNFVFGDHEWYNESRVRKIVKGYSALSGGEKVAIHSRRVLEAYDQLAKIKKGQGTYADGILRNSLKDRPTVIHETVQALYASLPEMPEVKAFLHQTAKAVGVVALVVLQAYFKSDPKMFLAAKLLEAAAKDLKVDLSVPTVQRARPRSHSVA